MELRTLRYFLAVAQAKTISAAAEALHVTQPTLSRQMQELEEELGKTLFLRGKRSITLTEEGTFFRKRAQEVVSLLEKTTAELRAPDELLSGDIHIGGGETDAMRQIARIIGELHEDYPDIRYHIYSGNAEDVTERLDQGRLDFGILIQPVDLAKYNYVGLPARDVWGVIMRRDSPLAEKTAVTRRDLLSLPLLCSRQVLRQISGVNEYLEWFGEDFGKLNIVGTYNLIYNAALMVNEGIGYAVTLDKLVNVIGSGNLCFRPLKPKLESGLNIVWKKYQVFSSAAELFLERIQEKFAGSNGG